MNIQKNISTFEAELAQVQRPGMDKLLEYIRKSDFYTAPASTKHHLACEGGLLQHSLNVLDALRSTLHPRQIWTKGEDGEEKTSGTLWDLDLSGHIAATFNDATVIMAALLHDICKANYYTTTTRNVKNDATGKWEKVPFYTVDDKMPLGHGAKSAMIIKEYTSLTSEEMYAIWHHMGFVGLDPAAAKTFNAAARKYPLIWALHNADMLATAYMEGEKDNLPQFQYHGPDEAPATEESGAAEWADAPALAPA